MNTFPPLSWTALMIGAVITARLAAEPALAGEAPCADSETIYIAAHEPSWIFQPGTYTHDPTTGARVAQYMRKPPVEPLDDERAVTSSYRRTRTVLRGRYGSSDTYYQVQAWGNGRGGIDAEWERFHDAWKESILSGGYYHSSPAGPWGYGAPGYGGPGYGGPGYGGPGYGGPGYGGPGYGYGGVPHGVTPGYGYGHGGPGFGYPSGHAPPFSPHVPPGYGGGKHGGKGPHGDAKHD